MNAQVIGRYRVGDDELVLRVPDDEVSRVKINAIVERMEAAESAEMSVTLMAVLFGVLSNRSTEEIMGMVPMETINRMMEDFKRWTNHLRPVRPC